jgi:tetratricopeptide (TPR) repeat protein
MDGLCRTTFRICVATIIVFFVTGTSVTAHKPIKKHAGAKMPARIPSVKNDLTGTVAGLKIVTVAPKGAAARAGLRYGDVLIAYNNRPITKEEELDAVMRFFGRQQDKKVSVELSLYREGDLTVRTFRVPLGRLGIYTREWTLAGAFVEEASGVGDYVSAEKYVAEATASGQYTGDQLLHMRLLCLNNEATGEANRQNQVDELYRTYPTEKLRLFANYDLLYHKRYRAAAAIFEKYLKLNRADVATEFTLASCYTELEKYDHAEALLARIVARPETDENAATPYVLSELSNLRARIYMGRGQYGSAQELLKKALDQYADNSYYALAFLYCAARREVVEGRTGEFDAAYEFVTGRSEEIEQLVGYHIDALRAYVQVKRHRVSAARATVAKWMDSADARQFVPVFWRSFPNGAEIIDNWNRLIGPRFRLTVGITMDRVRHVTWIFRRRSACSAARAVYRSLLA